MFVVGSPRIHSGSAVAGVNRTMGVDTLPRDVVHV